MKELKEYKDGLESVEIKQPLHARLHSKRVFVFDWDGTILDSMQMKAQNFVQAFKMVIPESLRPSLTSNSVAEHYLRLSGRPRKQIFYGILNLLNLEPDKISYDCFNEKFEMLNRQNLIYTSMFIDATDLLMTLIESGRQIFISSSVPPNELTDLVDKILPVTIRHNITSVLGSLDGFAKGAGHLQWIIKETGATRDQILVVGDDIADYELSSEAGVDCVLVDRKSALRECKFNTVSDLYQLRDDIKNEI